MYLRNVRQTSGKKALFVLLALLLPAMFLPIAHITAEDDAGDLAAGGGVQSEGLVSGQPQADNALAPGILVFADDPVHRAPDTFVDLALNQLELEYVAEYEDIAAFEAQLGDFVGGLVIFANDVSDPRETTIFATLLKWLPEHLEAGGLFIFHTWVPPEGGSAEEELWKFLGVIHAETIVLPAGDPAAPMFWWREHRFFDNSEIVPEFHDLANYWETEWPVQHVVETGDPFAALAGYREEPDPTITSLVLNEAGTTVFRGFVDFINDADLDKDCLPDGFELWKNMIATMLGMGTPPSGFCKSSPANNATGQATNVTLRWDSTAGADSYQYCVDTSNNEFCDGVWVDVGSSTSANPAGLAPNTTYYWQARALNTDGKATADLGAWWKFTTLPIPGAFGKISPANNATEQTLNLSLSWGGSANASSYEYCVDISNNNVCNESWVNVGNNTSANPAGLLANTDYYWQVRAKNFNGEVLADSGAWWKFTTLVVANPPGAFNKSSPANNATDQPTNLTLSWGSSSGANSYQYCVDTSNDGVCNGGWTSTGSSTSANPAGLATGTIYYWQAQAVNGDGNTEANGGAWWNFTTIEIPQSFVYLPVMGKNFCGGFTGPGEEESNNQPNLSSANGPLCPGNTYTGTVPSGLDNDYFYIRTSSTGKIKVDVTNYTTDDAQLLLYDADVNFIVLEGDQPDGTYHIESNQPAGIYFIRLVSLAGHPTLSGEYTLTVTFP